MSGRKNLSIRLAVCVLMLAIVVAVPAAAVTHYVSPGQSIQTAIDASLNSDEIEVAPGTYNEAIDFKGKAIRLYSSGGPDVTTIDANGIIGAYHVVQCVNGEDANTILEGFTITGGNANGIDQTNWGGGMYNKGSSPKVTNCIFRGNRAGYGGGVLNDDSSPTVTDCTFTDNTATDFGGGMENYNGSSPTVTGCTFSGNTALSATCGGGGMLNNDSSPTVTNCTFSNNTASTNGGGMYNLDNSNPMVSDCTFSGNEATNGGGMFNDQSSPTVTNCTFSDNTATEFGGGMYNGNSSNPTVTDCNFTNNSAKEGGGMHNGSSSSPIVTNCTFSGNTASPWGGGMYNHTSSPTVINCTFTGNNAVSTIDTGRGGGMFNNWYSSPVVTECIFIGNSSDYYGGGMYNYDYSSPTVINCTFSGNTSTVVGGGMANADNSSPMVINGMFRGNTADYGAGIHGNFSSSPTMTNCAFSGNTAGTDGGGMYNTNSSSPTLTNCTFTSNTAGNRGGAIFCYNSSPKVTNCILWGDTPYEFYNSGGSPTITYSDVQGGWGGAGNINADPCFVDAAEVNLRLSYDSPCVDVGDNNAPNLPATDLAGNRRIFDGDGDGHSVVDMGAYEFGSLNLLAHWKLDESSGETAYDSTGDNHGILEPSPPVWQPAGGQVGGALQFDGVDDYVDCGNDDRLNITDEITLAAWVKTNDTGNGQFNPYVSKGDQSYAIKHQNSNNIEFVIYDSGWHVVWYPVDGSFNDDWHHLAGTYDGSQLKLYVDGELEANSAYSGSIAGSTFNVNIGRNAEVTDRFYNGLIDDVVIFSSALADTEITDLKNNGGASFIGDPDLKALWKLDESSGTTASDSSGNGIDGSLEPSSPVWQPAGGWLGGALEFDGVDDFVSIPNESRFDITYQLTVSAWIRVAAFDKDWQAIVTKGDRAWRIQRDAQNNALEFACTGLDVPGTLDGNVLGSVNVNDGQWHHVAGVYDGTKIYLYVDGVVDNNEPASGTISTNDYPVMIGENAEERGRYWNGLVDDVRIYTSALSPSEVYQLYINICYVDADATGNNNGSSWTDAFNYLQDALAEQATSGSEIRVAEGTYKPDANSSNPSGSGDRTATFELINGVILKGGYAGFGQPNPNARDCDLYETTLSGDINTPGDANDNCYHVVTSSGCDPNTVLEGFTITGGNANGTFPDDHGGGMYNSGSNPTVSNCIFTDNASQAGGGMCNNQSSPTVTNCTFTGNTATQSGGGMHNRDGSSPTVENCSFFANTAGYSGGMFNGNSSPTVTNCTFSDNSANWGGGMYNYQSSPKMINCTFSGNSATNAGGGILNQFDSSPIVTNCIFRSDTPIEIADWDTSTTTVTYSDVEGGYSGTGNIDADPCFVDAAAGNLRLSPGSPCIEAGNNSEPNLPLTDLDGHPRIIDGDCDEIEVVDMGAYEFNYAYMGDLDYNCSVDFFDFSIFGRAWMTQEGDPDWDWACDMSDPPDDYIDWRDAAILCGNWLTQIP